MITFNKELKVLAEHEYDIAEDAKNAALFTTGNGYFGVRGSFEEFGALNVQGTYIRGLIDQGIEIPSIYVDNIYMKKYYIDEVKAKQFEYQDLAINIVDFLLIRFRIGDQYFFPWEGKIISWIRYIDPNDGSLNREAVWDDGLGRITKLNFKRYASFSNNHNYLIEASLTKINHDLPCEVESGIDYWIKSNGQKKSVLVEEHINDEYMQFLFNAGDLYNYQTSIAIHHIFDGVDKTSKKYQHENGMIIESYKGNKKTISVKKLVYAIGTMDLEHGADISKISYQGIKEMMKISYQELYQAHLKAYREANKLLKIEISNPEDQALIDYSNYQTLIGIDRYSEVHSVTAKNLTGEKYNQFVWWDAEIYQFPVYLMTMPKAAKKILMYRYHRLDQSRINAKLEGYDGAKFAFCSSVLGDEKVWSYARHPFMQIHINSDIAYAILSYVRTTNDKEFMSQYGIEMLYEISKYFVSRVEYNLFDDVYELKRVTGTDEHHPYVNNNSYTNYMVKLCLNETYEYLKANADIMKELSITEEALKKFKNIAAKIKTSVTKDGYIPQFDGYFNLRGDLEIKGSGAAKSFQMKASGLYHESQIIKQPDVMMLFTYINIDDVEGSYEKNWHYYEKKCEASSSLTYPVHAICAIDHLEYDKFYDYWHKSCAIDIIDHHHEAHLGLHAACMAGGWYSIFRGIFGAIPHKDYLVINPKRFDRWNNIKLKFAYQGSNIELAIQDSKFSLISEKSIAIKYNNKIYENQKSFTKNILSD
jgi:trehalose/maltose hydrolase-like predicted phosphorylase